MADELFTPNYAHHDPSTPDVGRGPESEKKRATLYRTAFPDLRLTIEDIIAEGETVMVRWSCRGTHKGDLSGIAPTGNQVTISGVSIARFTGGKMAEAGSTGTLWALCSSSASSLSSPKPKPPLRSLRSRTTFKSGSREQASAASFS